MWHVWRATIRRLAEVEYLPRRILQMGTAVLWCWCNGKCGWIAVNINNNKSENLFNSVGNNFQFHCDISLATCPLPCWLRVHLWTDMRVSFCLFLRLALHFRVILNAYRYASAHWLIDRLVQCLRKVWNILNKVLIIRNNKDSSQFAASINLSIFDIIFQSINI